MIRSGISKLSVQRSKLQSNYSAVRSQISSTIDRLADLQNEKHQIARKLPFLIRSLQFFLSIINFFLFSEYVALFGCAIASCITAFNEDCLKVPPTYQVIPERVNPNTVGGYNCTGIRLFEKDDHFQISLLVLLLLAIGLQMLSSNLAFVGAMTLTTKNIKLYIWLFVLSTTLLIAFFVFDFPLKKGRQYIKYFGAYNTPFLFIMLVVAISHVFSGFFSIVLLLQWANFVNDLNKFV